MASNTTNTDNGHGCKCMPYRDVLLIVAQGLSIVGFFLAWGGGWLSGLLSTAAMVLLMVAFCCPLNKCAFIVAGVLGSISAALCIIAGSLYLANSIPTAPAGPAVAVFIGACFWIGAAICLFIFICNGRMEKYLKENERDDDDGDYDVEQGQTVANKTEQPRTAPSSPIPPIKASPSGSSSVAASTTSSKSSTKKTITHHADGSIETTVEITRPDGSKEITTIITQAPARPPTSATAIVVENDDDISAITNAETAGSVPPSINSSSVIPLPPMSETDVYLAKGQQFSSVARN